MTDPARQLPLEQIAAEERVAALGALLFVATEPAPLALLAQQLGCTIEQASEAAEALAGRLAAAGLTVQRAGDAFQLGSAPQFGRLVQRFLGLERSVRLSQAALETLAIVAYRQPVTRTGIEAVRGVDASGVLQTLLARGLIEPFGRLQAPGSPVLYGTTPDFLRFFGLSSLDDLPSLPEELTTLIAQTEVFGSS